MCLYVCLYAMYILHYIIFSMLQQWWQKMLMLSTTAVAPLWLLVCNKIINIRLCMYILWVIWETYFYSFLLFKQYKNLFKLQFEFQVWCCSLLLFQAISCNFVTQIWAEFNESCSSWTFMYTKLLLVLSLSSSFPSCSSLPYVITALAAFRYDDAWNYGNCCSYISYTSKIVFWLISIYTNICVYAVRVLQTIPSIIKFHCSLFIIKINLITLKNF